MIARIEKGFDIWSNVLEYELVLAEWHSVDAAAHGSRIG